VTNLGHRQRLAECIASLANPSGRSLTANELRIILRLAMWLQLHDGYSEFAAIEAASVWAGSGRRSIEPAYQHFLETNELLEPDTSLRGRGNPDHPLHDTSLTLEQILAIHQLMIDAKLKNEFMPAREIRRRLALPVGVRQTRNILRQLGYRWGRKRCVGTASTKQQTQRMRSFIRQLSTALQQQRDGIAVIGFTDESYLHTAHANQYCWYSPSSPSRNEVSASPSKGKRLILLHVMTQHGLLSAPRRGRAAAAPSNVVSDEDFTCELIFEGLVDSEDYHKNMNGQIFMQWVNKRLISTFQRRFPGKKLILVLDNAAYHHPRGDDWVNPNKMTKLELAAWISERADHITVLRDGVSKYFGKTSLFQNKSNYAPTVDEMRGWVKQYLLQHPTINRTLLQQRFDELGWQLIYTPPYQCECQPIEMLWAYVKNYVGRMMGSDHSTPTVTQLARQGFYGDPENHHAPADADLCQRLINHVLNWCNRFITADDELAGSMENLQEAFIPAQDVFDAIDDQEEAQQMDVQDAKASEEEESEEGE
jgi:transposase